MGTPEPPASATEITGCAGKGDGLDDLFFGSTVDDFGCINISICHHAGYKGDFGLFFLDDFKY